MKTFFNLVQEVQKPGLCYRCGGCVTFCTAINYGALELADDGRPVFSRVEKCIECGLCYAICPQINDLDDAAKKQVGWTEPMGRLIETTVVRATDDAIREKASDGGAVTALLLLLFDRKRIDGAIVTRPVGRFQRRPFLATTREEILESAGICFDTSQGMEHLGEQYTTFSSIAELNPMVKKGLKRVALVGTPCQIKSLRKMQALNLIPSDAVRICLGLFCAGNFIFGPEEQARLAKIAGGINWDDVYRISFKDQLLITMTSGEVIPVGLEYLDFMKRYACKFCSDYAAEFADISFGGIGATTGWTTVVTRTPLGRSLLTHGRDEQYIEQADLKQDPEFAQPCTSCASQSVGG